jgi:hypothetical protein
VALVNVVPVPIVAVPALLTVNVSVSAAPEHTVVGLAEAVAVTPDNGKVTVTLAVVELHPLLTVTV